MFVVIVLSGACIASPRASPIQGSATRPVLEMIGTIDSTSGVMINRSFAHRGIIEVMQATHSGGLRYPGTPAVACAFNPVQVTCVCAGCMHFMLCIIYVCIMRCMYVCMRCMCVQYVCMCVYVLYMSV